jgi:hypothetical protein
VFDVFHIRLETFSDCGNKSDPCQVMECLHSLSKLKELWLGRNRIRKVDLCGLNCIVKISIQSNRLTSMLGFQVWTVRPLSIYVSCAFYFNCETTVLTVPELLLLRRTLSKS